MFPLGSPVQWNPVRLLIQIILILVTFSSWTRRQSTYHLNSTNVRVLSPANSNRPRLEQSTLIQLFVMLKLKFTKIVVFVLGPFSSAQDLDNKMKLECKKAFTQHRFIDSFAIIIIYASPAGFLPFLAYAVLCILSQWKVFGFTRTCNVECLAQEHIFSLS